MASGPITSWQIDGEAVEIVADFIFLGSKIAADGDCSHEIKRHLLLGRKVMTSLDNIFKSRDITLPTKVCIIKALVFQQCSSKASILQCSAFFIVQLSHPYMTTGRTTALVRQIFIGKVMSLCFLITLSRLVIAFLPRSKRLLISWLQS